MLRLIPTQTPTMTNRTTNLHSLRTIAMGVLILVLTTPGCRLGKNDCGCGACGESGSSYVSQSIQGKSLVSESSQVAKSTYDQSEDPKSNSAELEKSETESNVQQASYVDGGDNIASMDLADIDGVPVVVEDCFVHKQDRFPVDFANVLRLAGADNWSVRIAREQICEAAANLMLAEAAILPSLNLGVVYNVHDGEIQATDGTILTASRNSLFIGGGAGIANSPLNGGSGGPARLFVDFSLADAMFKPLAARKRVDAANANRCRVLNDTLLEASLAYYEMVRWQSLLAIAIENLNEANQVLDLTTAFVEGGKGNEADIHRINVVVNSRRQDVIKAKNGIDVASARLAELLQLDACEVDPQIGLYAVEMQPLALHIVDWSKCLNEHIDIAQTTRCEITQAQAETYALNADHEAEIWRAVLPNLYLGYSGGVFGGGPGGELTGLDWRNDVDVGVTWQIKNLGYGNRALQNSTHSRFKQQLYRTRQIRDKVSQQVSTTYHQTRRFKSEIRLYSDNIQEAQQALSKNIDAIRGLEGLPLEAVQSLNDASKARQDYLNSVINYNQWQLRLLRATGQPFSEVGCCRERCGCCNCNGKCTSLVESCSCCECPKCIRPRKIRP